MATNEAQPSSHIPPPPTAELIDPVLAASNGLACKHGAHECRLRHVDLRILPGGDRLFETLREAMMVRAFSACGLASVESSSRCLTLLRPPVPIGGREAPCTPAHLHQPTQQDDSPNKRSLFLDKSDMQAVLEHTHHPSPPFSGTDVAPATPAAQGPLMQQGNSGDGHPMMVGGPDQGPRPPPPQRQFSWMPRDESGRRVGCCMEFAKGAGGGGKRLEGSAPRCRSSYTHAQHTQHTYRRPQICFFFNHGRCVQGHECPYSHTEGRAIRREPYCPVEKRKPSSLSLSSGSCTPTYVHGKKGREKERACAMAVYMYTHMHARWLPGGIASIEPTHASTLQYTTSQGRLGGGTGPRRRPWALRAALLLHPARQRLHPASHAAARPPAAASRHPSPARVALGRLLHQHHHATDAARLALPLSPPAPVALDPPLHRHHHAAARPAPAAAAAARAGTGTIATEQRYMRACLRSRKR